VARNGWRTSAGKPVANQELWLELEAEVIKHRVSWRHVRGHAGHELNELVDQVAGMMRREAIAEAPAVTDPLFNESDPPSDELDGPEHSRSWRDLEGANARCADGRTPSPDAARGLHGGPG
jgi:hypothetical protein